MELELEESAIGTDRDRRHLTARWIVTVDIKLMTAALIGSHAADNCDMTFERDAQGRVPLHGTTLAGAFRNVVSDHLTGYRNRKEDQIVLKLFGDLSKHESPLVVFDTVSESAGVPASIRDGVRIDPRTGLAKDGLKYDWELALPDLIFPLRLDLLVGAKMDESQLVNALLLALDALCPSPHQWAFHLGGRRTRGLGELHALPESFRAQRFDLTIPSGWIEFARSGYSLKPLHKSGSGVSAPKDALQQAWPSGFQAIPMPDQRKRLSIECEFSLASTLLVRSPGQQADSADSVHLTEQGKQIFSGATLAGVLRSQCNRIGNTINPTLNPGGNQTSDDPSVSLVNGLFGKSPEWTKVYKEPTGSRLLVTEAVIKGGKVHRQTRVKIDRFTGGAIDTALFDEEPAVGGKVKFQIFVQNPSDAEIALVLFALRDVMDGIVAFGGESAVGRGILKGDAQVLLPGEKAAFSLASVPQDAALCERLNGYAATLHSELGLTKGGRNA